LQWCSVLVDIGNALQDHCFHFFLLSSSAIMHPHLALNQYEIMLATYLVSIILII
jgi:hypothetical protein